MKRIICFLISFVLLFSSQSMYVPAYASPEQIEVSNQPAIPASFVADATYHIEVDSLGNEFIVLTCSQDLSPERLREARTSEVTTVCILAESDETRDRLIQEIIRIKESESVQRASGSYTDQKWFHGSSLCVTSTVYYSTIVSAGITYGKITSVYVECSVINGTVIDNIAFDVGQYGYTPSGGLARVYETPKTNIANRSTVNVADDLPYVFWNDPSFANARIYVTVHRGTSSQSKYTFYVAALGEVQNG